VHQCHKLIYDIEFIIAIYYHFTMIAEITKLTNGNRVVIPATIRKSLGLKVGDAVTLVLRDNGEVRLLTQAEAIRQAQQLVRQFVPEERSLVEELLMDRRAESEQE
jgi:AbrB family looped-hinge helix DNA binding protein